MIMSRAFYYFIYFINKIIIFEFILFRKYNYIL
jgi:hypothetical protein